MAQTEVMRLREQIAREHEAACWALSGLATGTLQHRFIDRRMRRIDVHVERLSCLVGEPVSTQMVNQVFTASPQQGEKR